MKTFSNAVLGGILLLVIGFVVWAYVGEFRADRQEQNDYAAALRPDPAFRPKTPEEKLESLRAQAAAEAVRFVTNSVTGFRRMIFCSTLTLDPAVSNWTGIAEAEFINRLGGVEKEFVHMRFRADGNRLSATPDLDAKQNQFEAAVLRAFSGQK